MVSSCSSNIIIVITIIINIYLFIIITITIIIMSRLLLLRTLFSLHAFVNGLCCSKVLR